MISASQKDDNVTQIVNTAGILNLATKYNWRFYGLKQQDNPAVLIEFAKNLLRPQHFAPMAKFFNTNKIRTEVSPLTDKENKHAIYVGLRLDLRQNIDLASRVVKTILYAAEGKLKMSRKVPKINKLPVFK